MHALVLEQVGKAYGRRIVFDALDLALDAGTTCGIIGPNGAGKTTLLRVMAGLLESDRGRVRVCGESIDRVSRGTLAYFAGESSLPPPTPVSSWCGLFGADGSRCRDRRRLGVLSRGSRQLVGLQAVFAAEGPRLLILDEPWEGLDPDASRWLSLAIERKNGEGAAVVASSHRLGDLAGLCRRYAFLVDRRLVTMHANDLSSSRNVTAADLMAVFDRLRRNTNVHA